MYMPTSTLSWQTTLNKAKFLEFGIKNANLATLISIYLMSTPIAPIA